MTKKRGNNEGSIHKLPSGTWRAQITLDGRRMSFTAKTHRECQEWLKKMIRQIDDGMTYSATKTTVAEFLSDWITSSKARLRPRTWEHYEQLSRQYIVPKLGTTTIRDLHIEKIQKFYDGLLAANVGVHTVLKIHALLSVSLGYATKLGLIPRNPAKLTMPPKKPVKEMKFLDESQVSQLLITAQGSRLEALFQLAIATGLRQMELLGLQWTDLDWIKRKLKVERQLAREKNSVDRFVPPKSKAGRRTVALGEKTIKVLRAHLEQQQAERIAAGDNWQENGLIFSNHLGGPVDYRDLTRDFKKLLSLAGLPEIRFHDLRHTTATLLLNENVNPIVVSKRLGHSRTSVTLDTYGHLLQNLQEEVAETIDDLITPVPVDCEIFESVTQEVLPSP